MSPLPQPRRRAREGFIIVAVLWILGALATLATVYAFYVNNAAVSLGVHDERVQAEALTSAAVELAVYRMTAGAAPTPTRGRFDFRARGAGVTVEFRSEAARIDLNAAPKALLAGLFTALGAVPELAQGYADRVIAWRTPVPADAADDETAAYRTAGLPYGPRLAPFPHPSELTLVLGLPEVLVERALPFVTVYSGQPQVHAADAAPEVLAALPGMTPGLLREILARRDLQPQNAQELMAAMGPSQGFATSAGSKAVRVTVRIDFANGRRMRSEAVILLSEGAAEPYHVLSWRDLDDTPDDATTRAGTR